MRVPADPYIAPSGWAAEYAVSVSPPLTGFRTGLTLLVIVQMLTGIATTVVIDQEGNRARGFIMGMSLLTMILSALVVCAVCRRITTPFRRTGWGLLVTVVAWATYLLSLRGSGYAIGAPAGMYSANVPRVLLMICVTGAFVLLFVHATCPRPDREIVRKVH